jgi:hypothetical protein
MLMGKMGPGNHHFDWEIRLPMHRSFRAGRRNFLGIPDRTVYGILHFLKRGRAGPTASMYPAAGDRYGLPKPVKAIVKNR